MTDRLAQIARKCRRDIINMDYRAASGHGGGSLSCVDILVALYFGIMDIAPDTIDSLARDRFVFSKGHSAEALYAVLAAKGFLPEDELMDFEREGSRLYGHPTRKVPGVEVSTGALGHGLSVAAGMALAQRMDGIDRRVFVLLGDGEMAEGSNWEAMMAASHHGLDRLVAIVDRNGLQISGPTERIMALDDLCARARSFGWQAVEVDGHDIDALVRVLGATPLQAGRPTLVCAHTVKGKGVSFMENQLKWHHGVMNADQYEQALQCLGADAGEAQDG